MAESVVFAITGTILSELSSEAYGELGRLWRLESHLEKLQNTVSAIQAVLLHAEEQYQNSHQVKDWAAKLKDALYDAEDLLGDFFVESRLRDLKSRNNTIKEVSTFFSTSNQLFFRFKMACKLRRVTEKIDAIKAARTFYLEERPVDKEVKIKTRRDETEHSFIREKEMIGRDADKREMLELLLQDSSIEENVSVISIVVIGGLGKTALARYVYNDEIAQKHFNPIMWVTVSSDFNMKKIVGEIIASAKNAGPEHHLGMNQLQAHLRNEIDGKRYLLVLDDLWNDNREEWLQLRTLLDGGAKGSKVLITTRDPIVAAICGTDKPYFLEGLSSSASLDLFMQIASAKGQEITELEKASIGKEIVDQCCGVPLAIRVIGSTLYSRKTIAEWLYFKDSELQKIHRKEDGIIAILRLSYDHLAPHLKQCFAFCSLFPKGYDMPKSTLIDLWVAQGFIQQSSSEDQDLEDVAHRSFMHLLSRNFFQDRVCDDLGNVKTCKMHDLMHDLACAVAGTDCTVAGLSTRGAHYRTLHLAFKSSSDLLHELQKLQGNSMKLRTLLLVLPNPLPEPLMSMDNAFLKRVSNLRNLRALTLQYTNMKVFPRFLCKLKHLCYLDCSYNRVMVRLPNSIKKLQNLMTLKLIQCSSLKELPRNITKLVSLRHLYLSQWSGISHMPRGLGHLTSLHTLSCFVVGEDKSNSKPAARLNELSGLSNLRGKFTIRIQGHIENAVVESKRANLNGKHNLEELELFWDHVGRNEQIEVVIENHEALLEGLQPHKNLQRLSISSYMGVRFPKWMMEDITHFLPILVRMDVSGCDRCRYLPTLGFLPYLKILCLHRLSALESIDHINYHHSSSSSTSAVPLFPRLSYLSISYCPRLKSMPELRNLEKLLLSSVNAELVKQSVPLRRLKQLEIRGIELLESLPEDWLQNLSSLEELCIRNCPNLTSLSLGMQYLSSLVTLKIDCCEALDLSRDENHNVMKQLRGLSSLRELVVSSLPKFTALPEWFFHVTSLERLSIYGCSNMTALSDHMDHLASLRQLELFECHHLTSLPESMRLLKSLQHLHIVGCEQLEEKCKKGTGQDWNKISHIPKVKLTHYNRN